MTGNSPFDVWSANDVSLETWLPSKTFETLRIPPSLEVCEEILRQCVAWGRWVCARLQTSDEDSTACKDQITSAVSDIASNIQYLREKEHEVTELVLERIAAAAKLCFCRLESSLLPEFIGGQALQVDVLTLRWDLYSDELDKLMEASEDLSNELRDDVQTEWGKLRTSGESRRLSDHLSHGPFAPVQLYIGKILSYSYDLERLRDRLYPIKPLGLWVNLSEIREWLAHCDKHHILHCGLSDSSRILFNTLPKRLIDVTHMCLIPMQSGQQYAALSYVWGKGASFKTLGNNLSLLYEPGSLSGDHRLWTSFHIIAPQIPKTLTDVIHITRELGIEYLWIDALCIIQDDDLEKREQLAGMGSIYANAYITLVAAGGTAFSGLCGLEHVTRPMQRPIETRPKGVWRDPGILWRHKIQGHVHTISRSAWSNRAWTFQEQIFSRRLLVLTNEAISWECHCAVWFEGIENFGSRCRAATNTIAQGFSIQLPPSFDDYAQHVTKYNLRNLTFPEDALSAFSGILGVLSTKFVDGFVCGIPKCFFDRGLCWWIPRNSVKPAKRRLPSQNNVTDMPPTWAWAAWEGKIAFMTHYADTSPVVEWNYYSRSTGSWSTVVLTQRGTPNSGTADHQEKVLDNPTILRLTKRQNSDLLFVRAGRIYLRITNRCRGVIPWNSFWGIPLVGNDGVCVGKIDGNERIEFNGTEYLPCELIAISESAAGDLYNVLWIEWHDEVALRKGLGRVLKRAWEAASPVLVDVLLG